MSSLLRGAIEDWRLLLRLTDPLRSIGCWLRCSAPCREQPYCTGSRDDWQYRHLTAARLMVSAQ
jgi:hypothetical protein